MNASLYQPEGNDVSDVFNSFICWISCAVIEEFGKGEKKELFTFFAMYTTYIILFYTTIQ